MSKLKLIAAASLSLTAAATVAPTTPQQWTSLNATYSNYGTMPDCSGGETLSFFYDFTNKRQKQLWHTGTHAGYTDVFRYDKKVPGELWSRLYHWKPGQEGLCCHVDLCRPPSCDATTVKRMQKLEVAQGSTDEGTVAANQEHWFKDMSIKVLGIGSINDWIVDTTNSMAITNWTSNASLPKAGWCKAQRLFGEVTLGNLTEADFGYPRMCDNRMCDGAVEKSMREFGRRAL
jgi:hypothetical protein